MQATHKCTRSTTTKAATVQVFPVRTRCSHHSNTRTTCTWLTRQHGSSPKMQLRRACIVNSIEDGSTVTSSKPRTSVVWFRNDLRFEDHPGLQHVISSGAKASIPVYVLDPQQLTHLLYNPAGPELLVYSLHHLRASLRAVGSDLIVSVGGDSAKEVRALAADIGAGSIAARNEVEVKFSLPSSPTPMHTWSEHIWSPKNFTANFRDWEKVKGDATSPLPAPSAFVPLSDGVDVGEIPSAEVVRSMLIDTLIASTSDSAMQAILTSVIDSITAQPEHALLLRLIATGYSPLELLRAYLRCDILPSSHPLAFLQSEVQKLEVPAVPGGSFTAIFRTLMSLGALSRRQVYYEAVQAEGERHGGCFPMGRLTRPLTIAATTAAMRSEFHWQLAERNDERQKVPGASLHYWSWRDSLADYVMAKPTTPLPGAPAVMLVHGFGAFGDQWRDNVSALANAGYTVYAPTLPGFGRSQKSALPYSQDAWRDYLRDFVLQVIQRPVVLAGNSIGGFISTSLAADYPDLCRGLVLLNSAGPIDPKFELATWAATKKVPPPAWVVQLIASGLFVYLEKSIKGTLKWLYPTAPDRADEWLGEEIFRAACDSGSLEVFKSAFYLPPPRALNYMVKEMWKGPTMVLQGGLDPLNDAKGRAKDMGALCDNVDVQIINAGHCPHDEAPDLVNKYLLEFIKTRVLQSSEIDTTSVISVAK